MKNMLDRELEILHTEVIAMGALCEEAIACAIKAVEDNDEELAKKTVKLENMTNKYERDIEDVCLKSLLRQQPVAKDLRKISSALKLITDLERIGDQARDIAEISLIFKFTKIPLNLKIMASEAINMLSQSINSYVANDLENCQAVIKRDNIVDNLFVEVQNDIVKFVSEDSSLVLEGMYLLMIAKYFERIADHATNISEWVEFSITGVHKGEVLF